MRKIKANGKIHRNANCITFSVFVDFAVVVFFLHTAHTHTERERERERQREEHRERERGRERKETDSNNISDKSAL